MLTFCDSYGGVCFCSLLFASSKRFLLVVVNEFYVKDFRSFVFELNCRVENLVLSTQ